MNKFTITYHELKRLIDVAAPHAGKDRLLPVFMQVRVESVDGKVMAKATDRYTFVYVKGESACPDGVGFGLSVKDWRHVLALFRPQRRTEATLSITVTEDAVTVDLAEGILQGVSAASATYMVVDGAFPKLNIRPKMNLLGARDTEVMAFGPAQVAKLPSDRYAFFIPGALHKPSFWIGTDFCIAIMPINEPADDTISGWMSTDSEVAQS